MHWRGACSTPDSAAAKPVGKISDGFLRRSLRIKPDYPECAKDPEFCRANKVAICWPVQADPWERTEMSALLRLIYQVRCSLFHGKRRLTIPEFQTNRDRELLSVSNHILNTMFGWLC